jgi:hypothetical protein
MSEHQDRLESWHLVDDAGVVRSGGATVAVAFAALPGVGAPIARVASRFPRTTSSTYKWVAGHHLPLGRVFKPRARAWAA